jgi:hypothetical protein
MVVLYVSIHQLNDKERAYINPEIPQCIAVHQYPYSAQAIEVDILKIENHT